MEYYHSSFSAYFFYFSYFSYFAYLGYCLRGWYFLSTHRAILATARKSRSTMKIYVTMRLKSILMICLQTMWMNLNMNKMQGITVKSIYRHFITVSCWSMLSEVRYTCSMNLLRRSLMRVSCSPEERKTRLRRQSMTELKASAFTMVMQSCRSILSSMVSMKMMLKVSLWNRSFASKSKLFLQIFLSNFLKTNAFSFPTLVLKRQRKRLLVVELSMITKRTKSMQMMRKCMREQRKLRISSSHISPGLVSLLMNILGSFQKYVLPVVVNMISKIMIESPTLYNFTVFCPRKKWYREETSKYSKSWMMMVKPAMMMPAKREVLLILGAWTMGRMILKMDAMRSHAKRTIVSQTAQRAQKAYSQQQAQIRRMMRMNPLTPRCRLYLWRRAYYSGVLKDFFSQWSEAFFYCYGFMRGRDVARKTIYNIL